MRRFTCLALLLALAACRADVPSGRYACDVDGDCPPAQTCRAGLCYADSDPPDAARDLGGLDAGRGDGGLPDATITEGGVVDGGTLDASTMDGSTGDLGGPDTGTPDLGAPDAGCTLVTESLVTRADTTIVPTNCNGANHLGHFTHTHTGIGRTLYTFGFTSAVRQAFLDGRVRSLAMRLTRFTDFSALGPCGGICPATAGTLSARPLRYDWAEGSDGSTTFTPYAGADWCRRVGGDPAGAAWSSEGASTVGNDVLGMAGSTTVTADQAVAVIPLDPTRWSGVLFLDALLAVQVLGSADGAATFLAWSREGSAESAARLEVSYCPP